jgi:large subunit ribosomal protein L29
MKPKDIKALSNEDIKQKITASKKELYTLRYQRRIGRVERPSQFSSIKKDIARFLTVLNEREKDGTKS